VKLHKWQVPSQCKIDSHCFSCSFDNFLSRHSMARSKRKRTEDSDDESVKHPKDDRKVCISCDEPTAKNQFPRHLQPGHDHERNTCRSCFSKWIDSQLSDGQSDQIKCPECDLVLTFRAIKGVAYPTLFTRSVSEHIHLQLVLTSSMQIRKDNH